jgi:hypothetical protein
VTRKGRKPGKHLRRHSSGKALHGLRVQITINPAARHPTRRAGLAGGTRIRHAGHIGVALN